uniref:Uncharacterized protein n=1 Tax=Candidatus Kentrum sp. LPFa TaxID=2126335 RepID=A0A450W014_9GAMM|nr:MAG: hypothetical protein BECKLPF1236A_GA0070988_100376 [Candidatus Kentron sp. LPFa]VFK26498.1 MAG: hypothetical protein BECKLPF1236C_GA0070990_100366 [Candidatus Kentron sp. LPFa]
MNHNPALVKNREHYIFLRFHFIEPGIAPAEHSCHYSTHTGSCGKPLARKITIFVRLISVRVAEFSRWFFTIRLIASAIFRHDSILEIAGKWNMDV